MSRCKFCHSYDAPVDSFGYCDDCKEKLKANISRYRGILKEIASINHSNISEEEKATYKDQIRLAYLSLKEMTTRKVPYTKDSGEELRNRALAAIGEPAEPIEPKQIHPWRMAANILVVVLGVSTIVLGATCFQIQNKLNETEQWAFELSDSVRAEVAKSEELQAKIDKLQAPIQKQSYPFQNGNFISGIDFLPGIYDITAMSGYGNVFSDNFDGGINAVMAPKNEDEFGFAEQSYSNIYLPEGTTLTVKDVQIRIKRTGELD